MDGNLYISDERAYEAEHYVDVQSKNCTKCHTKGRVIQQPNVYVDRDGNEFSSQEYALTGPYPFLGVEQLPNADYFHLFYSLKIVNCDRCGGSGKEYYVELDYFK